MTFHSGVGGTATVGGAELPVTDWNTDPSVEIVQFRNSKTGGYSVKEATYKDANFSVGVDYDFDANPFGIAGGLTIGTILSNVKLFLRGAGTNPAAQPYWLFPSAIVVSTPQRLVVNGNITTTFNFTASGTFSYPV
jgi:hypothetical protein